MSVPTDPLRNPTLPREPTTPRLLALSFYYPPANNPRAVQVDRLIRHVRFPTTVICAEYDEQNDRMDHQRNTNGQTFREQCIRVPYQETRWRKFTERFAHRFDLLLIDKRPDKFINWKSAVVRAVDELVRSRAEKADVLVTFGSPMSDHVIGLELKRRLSIPWIAHFSDPWVDNIFKDFNWLTRSMNVSLERKVMENADRLVFTSAETLDLVMAKYPPAMRTKSKVLPHAFEVQPESMITKRSSSSVVIRYVGDMYGRRTPEPLFRALKYLLNSNPDLLSDVHFEFVGSMHDLNLDAMGLCDLPQGLVTFQDTVSYEESLALMNSANGLLVIDAPAEQSVFLPSKLIDYVGTGRPIFGITPPGTAARLITELGGWVSNPANDKETHQTLESVIKFLMQTKESPSQWGDQAVRAKFDAQQVAREFENIIIECLFTPKSPKVRNESISEIRSPLPTNSSSTLDVS